MSEGECETDPDALLVARWLTAPASQREAEALQGTPVVCTSQFKNNCLERFRGGLVFKAHRLLYHSILGSRVTHKTKK